MYFRCKHKVAAGFRSSAALGFSLQRNERRHLPTDAESRRQHQRHKGQDAAALRHETRSWQNVQGDDISQWNLVFNAFELRGYLVVDISKEKHLKYCGYFRYHTKSFPLIPWFRASYLLFNSLNLVYPVHLHLLKLHRSTLTVSHLHHRSHYFGFH